MMRPRGRLASLVGLALLGAGVSSARGGDDFTDSFAAGREYFFLRSGNAQLIVQSDRTGTGPALRWMLFDADRPCQTLKKERAFNYTRTGSCAESSLRVILGGAAFTALPHATDVRWEETDGVPGVTARWWAGGISVRETFSSLAGSGAFQRVVVLRGDDIAGPDTVHVRLSLPPGRFVAREGSLVSILPPAAIGLAVCGETLPVVDPGAGYLETPPLAVRPGGEITIRTLFVTNIPAPGYAYERECADDRPIPARYFRTAGRADAPQALTARFYNNTDLRGAPVASRRDTNLSPYWGTGSPAPAVHPDSFSVSWTGYLLPPRTGTYRFSLVADDRARLFVGGKPLIDCWNDSWNVTKTAEISFTKGRLYPLRVEFAELTGWAGMRLRWTLPEPPPDEAKAAAGVDDMFSLIGRLRSLALAGETQATREYWGRRTHVHTGDTIVDGLYDHASFALDGMVGPGGHMDAGHFEYGDQWVRDGSNVTLGLLHAGQFESARSLLRYILENLVSGEGATVVSGSFDEAGREELDQMGELVHALKAYRDWTGDASLIAEQRGKILAMISRPLGARYRDSTGLVHDRREYWERTLADGYELAYQSFIVSGLRDAADLSGILGVPDSARVWREEAASMLGAMCGKSSCALVEGGAFIKRRNADGSPADFVPRVPFVSGKDDPRSTEAVHRLNPDASTVLPMLLRIVDPRSPLALRTLDNLEPIWNGRWGFGGYERYHSSSQEDQPGPWTFATAFIARAQHDAGLTERSRRSLAWLAAVQGGKAGAWFEEIPLIRSQIPTAGIVPWTSAEVSLFTVRHLIGISFEGDTLVIRPRLFPGEHDVAADVRFRSSRIVIHIDGPGPVRRALINGAAVPPGP
ncbi:MAG TPA: PA14 domain-containing protein, partial [Bacteroidota bacterium]|nr:PA14 domain-containing protein [Bacteroidota bacterium]